MDEEIEPAPALFDLGENRVEARASVTSQWPATRAELGGERLDALLQRVALVGERDLGALAAQAWAMPQAIERLLATPI